jgi:hypothetical protein
MTRDDILRMARDCGWAKVGREMEYPVLAARLERFAALVAAAEREACAHIADGEANDAMTAGEHNAKFSAAWNQSLTAKRIADAIRARGSK